MCSSLTAELLAAPSLSALNSSPRRAGTEALNDEGPLAGTRRETEP